MILWANHLTIIIYLCITGNGGFIGQFLSLNMLKPFSRITYCVYLVHPWIFYAIVGTRRSLIDHSSISILSIWISVIFLSYTLGLIFSVLFEAPSLHLLNYLKVYFIKKTINEDDIDNREIKLMTTMYQKAITKQ